MGHSDPELVRDVLAAAFREAVASLGDASRTGAQRVEMLTGMASKLRRRCERGDRMVTIPELLAIDAACQARGRGAPLSAAIASLLGQPSPEAAAAQVLREAADALEGER